MDSNFAQFADHEWDGIHFILIGLVAFTLVIGAILVYRFKKVIRTLKKEYATNQKLVEKRIGLYDTISPKLYDILSFFNYTGKWEQMTPPDILRLKRELDKEISICAPFFSEGLTEKYNSFMHMCFVSFSGWEHEEKIKSLYQIRKENNEAWNDDWIQCFDTNNVVDAISLKERYNELMKSIKKDLN